MLCVCKRATAFNIIQRCTAVCVCSICYICIIFVRFAVCIKLVWSSVIVIRRLLSVYTMYFANCCLAEAPFMHLKIALRQCCICGNRTVENCVQSAFDKDTRWNGNIFLLSVYSIHSVPIFVFLITIRSQHGKVVWKHCCAYFSIHLMVYNTLHCTLYAVSTRNIVANYDCHYSHSRSGWFVRLLFRLFETNKHSM